MAASFNKVFLMGNLTRDPELRYIPSGQAVTGFTIAVNRVYLSQSGEKKEEVSFLKVVVWGKRAEVCNEYLKKGSPVFVEGRLQTRSWDAPDGTKRSAVEVVAQSVQFLSRGTSGGAKSQASDAPAAGDDSIIDDSFGAPPEASAKHSNEPQHDEEVPF